MKFYFFLKILKINHRVNVKTAKIKTPSNRGFVNKSSAEGGTGSEITSSKKDGIFIG